MIIGLVGLSASGKDTVANYLSKKKGFRHLSLSDILRQEARKNGIKITMENLMAFGVSLKKEKGPNILAILAREQIKGDTVISSIRMKQEVEYFQQIPNFYLVEVDGGSVRNRYDRFVKRDREDSKSISYEKFLQMETEQRQGNGGQALDEVLEIKQETLDNTKDLKVLYRQIDKLVEKLNQEKKVYQRPTWDEYFLRLMEVIGERGTCDRGRSGAVIVKDRCLVATGYVGSPAGMPHCDEVGHQLKQTVHEDGHISTHCVRTIHAEQNAILQAAKNGVPLEGTTLYCRMEPCPVCAKMIVNAGIKRVVSWNKYHGADETQSLFKQCGVKLDIVNNQFEKYENQ